MGRNALNRIPVGAHNWGVKLYDCWFDGIVRGVSSFATFWRVFPFQGFSFRLSLRLIGKGKMEDGIDYSWNLNCLVGSAT